MANRFRTKLFRTSLVLVACVAIMASCSSLWAAAQAAQPVPDVVVMVMSGLTPADGVTFSYNAPTDEKTAKKDLLSLLVLTKWQPKDMRLVAQGNPKTTSIEFYSNGIVNWSNGTFPVEPFAVTFKRFSLIRVQYLLQGTFPFHALRNYSDKYVDIAWDPGKGNTSYGYTIKIKDHNFDKLGLPLSVDPSDEAKTAGTGQRTIKGASIFFLFLIAACLGVVVFVVLSRVAQNRKE